jgi:hypothetical protein
MVAKLTLYLALSFLAIVRVTRVAPVKGGVVRKSRLGDITIL